MTSIKTHYRIKSKDGGQIAVYETDDGKFAIWREGESKETMRSVYLTRDQLKEFMLAIRRLLSKSAGSTPK
jgi:hypothetical protein